MKNYHHVSFSMSLGGDEPTWEGEVTVVYRVIWGAQERGPTYDCGGTPADPDEIADIIVTSIDGASVLLGDDLMQRARDLQDHIKRDEALISRMLAHAAEQEG